MSLFTEFEKREQEVFPQNKIILWDGRMLDCYPLAAQAPDKIDEDHLELDKTGQYLNVGTIKPQPVPPKSEEAEEQEQLFIKNAFYLLAHKERIMSDSRMFLCRIPIQSGLAYTGISGFRNPTLGIYLEWWSIVEEAMRTDSTGRKSLVYRLAGSPLSGINKCAAVREDGETEIVYLSSFYAHSGPFTRINNRYAEAKQLYQAYTLQEVLDILNQEEDNNIDYAHTIEMQYMTHEIEVSNMRIEQIKEERDMWYNKYTDTLIRYNEDKIRKFYAEYETLKTSATMEIEQLKEQKRDLKAELKSGQIDNLTYQKKLMPLTKRIRELETEINCFKFINVLETFPDERDISFSLIEHFVLNTRKNNDEDK